MLTIPRGIVDHGQLSKAMTPLLGHLAEITIMDAGDVGVRVAGERHGHIILLERSEHDPCAAQCAGRQDQATRFKPFRAPAIERPRMNADTTVSGLCKTADEPRSPIRKTAMLLQPTHGQLWPIDAIADIR